MIDIPIISDPAHLVFLPAPLSDRLWYNYRSGINHRKWENSGVTQLLTLTATTLLATFSNGYTLPSCRSNNDSFHRCFSGDGNRRPPVPDPDLDRFRCLCSANRRSIPNLDKASNRPVTYPNLTLTRANRSAHRSPPSSSPPDTYRVSQK